MRKKTISVVIWFSLLAIMVAGGIVTGYWAFQGRNPIAKAAKEQLSLVREGQISTAYNQYMSQDYQERNSLEAFSKWIQNHPEMLHYDDVTLLVLSDSRVQAKISSSTTPPSTLVYFFVKEGKDWKVDKIDIESSAALRQFAQEKNEILLTIQKTLMHLKHVNLKDAYASLSKEFQNLITYDEFAKIVQENDELTDFEFIRYGNYEEQEDLRRIDVNLLKDDENHFVSFWLNKAGNEWKIWAIEVKGPTAQEIYEIGQLEEAVKPSTTETQGIETVVKSQLELLKSGNIKEAYEKYTADEFKKATSLPNFEKFAGNYPEFTQYKSIEFGEKVETNGLNLQNVTLTSDKGTSEVDFWLAKQNGEWKVWGIRVEESAFFPPIDEQEKTTLVDVIQKQLDILKTGDIKKAYEEYASADFQKNTPLNEFEKFVAEYPIFKEQTQLTVGTGIQEGELRLLRVALQSPEETAEADYRLINQDGVWKIWGIQILTQKTDVPENKEDVEKVVEEQIQAIKTGDIGKAYYKLTSKEFQEAASYDNFKTYVDKHDELKDNKTVKIESVKFKPSFSEVTVNLQGGETEEVPYIFRLTYDEGTWKILSIKMQTKTAPREGPSTITISKAVLGTNTDLKGMVVDPKATFNPSDKNIVVNLYITGGFPGDSVTATLTHVNTDSSIDPVTAELDKKGDSILNYLFTAPSTGWPVGDYKLEIKTSSGSTHVFEFKVI